MHHPTSSKDYIITFIALLILTVITVAISYVNLGILNIPVAIGVASIKMAFVGFIFMGLRYEKGINSILFIGAFACIIVFFLFTYSDIGFRGTIHEEELKIIDVKSPVKKKIKTYKDKH